MDKFIGDAVMAFWDATTTGANHATAACTAALRCQSALDVLHERWRAADKPEFRTRIGLNTGEVVIGNFGSEARLNYTIIGDAVNLSNRLEGLGEVYGTKILISESTYQQCATDIVARPVDYVAVKGRRLPVLIYELLGLKSEESAIHRTIIPLCSQGLEYYRRRDWNAAIACFDEVLRHCAGDRPSLLLGQRCRSYQANSPGPNWDGVSRLEHK